MEPHIRAVKRKFSHTLEPIKVMLFSRKPLQNIDEWVRFVKYTQASVIANPEEYLGPVLPEKDVIRNVVEMIFDEFLAQEGVRAALQQPGNGISLK